MASAAIPAPAFAPQPGLRSYIVYDQIPAGCRALDIEDNSSAPHLRPRDVAIIDPHDTMPEHGELFLIQSINGRRAVVVCEFNAGWDGWMVGHLRGQVVHSLTGTEPRVVRFMDGPYKAEDLEMKLLGKIVGIYEPGAALAEVA